MFRFLFSQPFFLSFLWFVLNVVLVLNIFFLFSPGLVDLAGHFSAAQDFAVVGYHGFSDRDFLGYIVNLYYPPLQNVLIVIFSWMTFGDFYLAGQIYLLFIINLFFFSVIVLSRCIPQPYHRMFFVSTVLVWMFVDRIVNIQVFQGFSLQDVFFTGLCTQFLGNIFLILSIYFLYCHLKDRGENFVKNFIFLTICIFFTIQSHLISTIVLFIFIFISLVFSPREKKILIFFSLLFGCCLSSHFLLPFIWNVFSGNLVSSKIVDHSFYRQYFFLLISSYLLLKILRFRERNLLEFLIAILTIFIFSLGAILSFEPSLVPSFHYYRLQVYGIFFILFLIFMIGNHFRKIEIIIIFSFIIINIFFSRILLPFISLDTSLVYHVDEIFIEKTKNFSSSQYGRTYFIRHQEPSDQSLHGMLKVFPQWTLDQKRTLNGTYWESAKTNHIFVSYQSSLFKYPGEVIDYTIFTEDWKQEEYFCIFDRFVSDMNIQHIVMTENLDEINANFYQKKAIEKILESHGTKNYKLENIGKIKFNFYNNSFFRNLKIYEIQQKSNGALTNHLIEILHINPNIHIFNKKTPFYFYEYMSFVYSHCSNIIKRHDIFDRKILFIDQNDGMRLKDLVLKSFLKRPPTSSQQQPIIEKIDEGFFKIIINSNEDVFFKIKLTPFPGLNLYSSGGESVPMFKGISYLLGYGKGEFILKYERPLIMKASYMASIFSFFVFLMAIFRLKKIVKF